MTPAPDDHPEARAEYLAAVAYYEEQRIGLGDELIERVEAAIRDIVSDPTSWPQLSASKEEPVLRCRRVEVFRYRVVYYVRGNRVRIVAYAHTSRRPDYWKHRVDG